MIGLAIGIVSVWGTVGLWMFANRLSDYGFGHYFVLTTSITLAVVLCAPIASLVVAWVIRARREVAVLTGARRVQVGAVLWGVVIGLIGVVLVSGVLIFCDDILQETLALVACGGVSSFVLLLARRRQPWACRVCGYDLRATLGRVPCPECGRVVEVSGDRR